MTTLPDAMLAAAFKASSFAMMITDTSPRILTVNEAFTTATGYTADEVTGRNPSLLTSGIQDETFYRTLWHQLLRDGTWAGEVWNRHRDGHTFVEWLSIDAIRDNGGDVTNYVGVFNDISSSKARESELEWRALHDPLTALPNRTLLSDRLAFSLERARREGHLVAVLNVDLDGFKQVNDSHGHAVGDQLLKEFAARLTDSVRSCDTVARLGGDEFVVICPDVESPRIGTTVANRILASLKTPVRCGEIELAIAASIGVAFYPLHGADAAKLLQRADAAMYHAKQTGKARIELAA